MFFCLFSETMDIWSYQLSFVAFTVFLVLCNCAPVDQNQLLDILSDMKTDIQKSDYDELPLLPYGGKNAQNYRSTEMDDFDRLPVDEKGKRLPPLPWNKRLPSLPWDKKASKRPLPPLPWNKRLQLDLNDADRDGYLKELLRLLQEWNSQKTEKRLPPLPWNKRLPPLPWNKRVPPLPWNKRLPPLPWNKRLPPLPWNKRLPPLPWNKRIPPLPWNKRMLAMPLNGERAHENDELESLINTLYEALQDLENHDESLSNGKREEYSSLEHFLKMTHPLQ